jgi:hypothetical protein
MEVMDVSGFQQAMRRTEVAFREFAEAVDRSMEDEVRAALVPRDQFGGLTFRAGDPLDPDSLQTAVAVVNGVEVHGHGQDRLTATSNLAAVLAARYSG